MTKIVFTMFWREFEVDEMYVSEVWDAIKTKPKSVSDETTQTSVEARPPVKVEFLQGFVPANKTEKQNELQAERPFPIRRIRVRWETLLFNEPKILTNLRWWKDFVVVWETKSWWKVRMPDWTIKPLKKRLSEMSPEDRRRHRAKSRQYNLKYRREGRTRYAKKPNEYVNPNY